MKPLHPLLIEWIEIKEKRDLLRRLMKAEEVVGQFGTITITYVQGQADKITAESTVREKC